jgi:glycosyltransferase involved in cell wall biosynthesis
MTSWSEAATGRRAGLRLVSPPGLSIVIPVFNEEENLRPLLEELRTALTPSRQDFEVLFVDDCSTDGSLEVLRRLAAEDSRIRVIRLAAHGGQSAALAAGIAAARAPVIATLDADLQADPADLPRLIEALDEGHDAVSGVRTCRHDPWLKRLSSSAANAVRRAVLRDSIHDAGCSLKVFRADALRRVPMFDGVHRFLPALLQLGGARVGEVPVNHRPRRHGDSKYGVHDRLWRGIVDLWAVRWLNRRRIDPEFTELRDE